MSQNTVSFLFPEALLKGMKESLGSEREKKQKRLQNTTVWWIGNFSVKYGTWDSAFGVA